MPRTLDFDKLRQFYLDLHLQRVMKFEPEKTGPFNRSHYMLGLRDRVLPTA